MKKRWTELDADVNERQEKQFAAWLSGVGISFENSEAENAYRERIGLLKNAIQLIKPPHRVPVCPSPGFFPIQYARSTVHEAMYDYDALAEI